MTFFNNVKYSYDHIPVEIKNNNMNPHKSNAILSESDMNQTRHLQDLSVIHCLKNDTANIKWSENNIKQSPLEVNNEYHPGTINPGFRALPDEHRFFRNPDKIQGHLKKVVPWELVQTNEPDEYFNEQNFQKIMNHPFYQSMKPFLEQPFKYM